jgi:hypothetical protein
MNFGLSLFENPSDFFRKTSPDVRCLEESPVNYWLSRDVCCRKHLFMPVNTQTTSDQLATNREMTWNPCNLHPYAAGFIMSRVRVLAVTYSILTSSWQFIPRNFSLAFVLIFLSDCKCANCGYRNTSPCWKRIRNQLIYQHFIKWGTHWHTATMQTPFSPPQRCQHSHW